jgi:hypothetical protein
MDSSALGDKQVEYYKQLLKRTAVSGVLSVSPEVIICVDTRVCSKTSPTPSRMTFATLDQLKAAVQLFGNDPRDVVCATLSNAREEMALFAHVPGPYMSADAAIAKVSAELSAIYKVVGRLQTGHMFAARRPSLAGWLVFAPRMKGVKACAETCSRISNRLTSQLSAPTWCWPRCITEESVEEGEPLRRKRGERRVEAWIDHVVAAPFAVVYDDLGGDQVAVAGCLARHPSAISSRSRLPTAIYVGWLKAAGDAAPVRRGRVLSEAANALGDGSSELCVCAAQYKPPPPPPSTVG